MSKTRNTRRRTLPALATATAAVVALAGCGGSDDDDLTRAEVTQGQLQGVHHEDNDTLAWLGVPYAQPPVGELRWRAPQPPRPWLGVREATQPAAECVQALTSIRWERSAEVVGSEDCLYLNVYRPAREGYRDEKLPVYVWIHGGSNNFGSTKQYDGTALATRADAVVVIVQYRLGQLGWLNHPAILADAQADPASASGNFGTLDNIRALSWVRENIAAFGGDPDNVTVAGESAGGHNVMNLLTSPLAHGLFARAFVQSAAMDKPALEDVSRANAGIDLAIRYHEKFDTVAEATALRQSMESAGTLGAYLQALPASVFYAGYVATQPATTLPSYGAYQDGHVLPKGDWMSNIRAGAIPAHIPVAIGANEHEQKAFMPLYGALVKSMLQVPASPHSWQNLIGIAHGESPLTVDEVLPGVDRDIYDLTGYHGGRAWYAKYAAELAQALSERGNPVHGFYFQWGGVGSGPSPFDFIYGAGHSAEIAFFHGGNTGLFGLSYTPENAPGRTELQHAMMDYLGNYMRSGDPNGGSLPRWERWQPDGGAERAIAFNASAQRAEIGMQGPALTLADVRAAYTAQMGALGVNPAVTDGLWSVFGQAPWPAAAP